MRRRFFLLPLTLLSLLLSTCTSGQRELHLFIWGNYIKPELIERFEQEFGCRVIIDLFESNEAMYAKLKASGKGYDLVFPSNYFLGLMVQQGLLQSINKSDIPNLRYLDTTFMKKILPDSREMDYAVPYMVSYTGIGVRRDRLGFVDRSWGIFADTALSKRMTMLNDVREVFGAALKFLGYSLNSVDDGQLGEATELLIEWKKNLAKYESEQYMSGIATAEYLVVQGYSGQLLQVSAEDEGVEFFLPVEGVPISCDYLVIPAEAPEPVLALQFINFLYDPIIAAENSTFTMYQSPNTGSYELLGPKLRENNNFFPSPQLLERSEVIKDVSPYTEKYLQAWETVRAAR